MPTTPRHRRIVPALIAFAGTLLIPLVCAQAAAADPPAPDSTALHSGVGASYWGIIPSSTDSTTAAFDNRGRKAWEWPLIVPYSVINLPLRWLRMGIGAGIGWAEDNNLFRYLNVIPVPEGFVPGVDYSAIEGLGLTLVYYNRLGADDNPLRIRASYSTNQWQKYTAGAILNRGGRAELQLGGGYRIRPDFRFFGLGPDSKDENESFYTDERAWAGANLRFRLTQSTFISLLGTFSSVVARESGTEEPGVSDVFPLVPPGFRSQSEGVMLRIGGAYTSAGARNVGNPDRGTILGATVGGFVSTNDDDVSFVAYRFEFQQFIPLWHSNRALAARAYINRIDRQGDDPIPFQRMFINETPDQFRGFQSSRWRDVGITGVTFEYRFPLMADNPPGGFGIDTALLADIGQVFDDYDEIRADNLTFSYGFGFRTFLTPSFLGSMEFMWGDEGLQFRLSTKQLFQFTRDVLYAGREETLIH